LSQDNTTWSNLTITQALLLPQAVADASGAVALHLNEETLLTEAAAQSAPWSLYADSKGKMGAIGLGKATPGAQLTVSMQCRAPAQQHHTNVVITYMKSYESVGGVRIAPKGGGAAEPHVHVLDALDTAEHTSTSALKILRLNDVYITASSTSADGLDMNTVELQLELLGPSDIALLKPEAASHDNDATNLQFSAGLRKDWKFKLLGISCC
jgi:hypothetical protein